MTLDELADLDVSSAEEFHTAIEEVVQAGVESGVDVRGAQEVPVEDDPRNFEVMISAIVDSDDASG